MSTEQVVDPWPYQHLQKLILEDKDYPNRFSILNLVPIHPDRKIVRIQMHHCFLDPSYQEILLLTRSGFEFNSHVGTIFKESAHENRGSPSKVHQRASAWIKRFYLKPSLSIFCEFFQILSICQRCTNLNTSFKYIFLHEGAIWSIVFALIIVFT